MTDQLHPKALELDERQRRLLWEVVTMVDPDTLYDNLERVGVLVSDTFGVMELQEALDKLSAILDPDGVFRAEWVALGAPMDGTGNHP